MTSLHRRWWIEWRNEWYAIVGFRYPAHSRSPKPLVAAGWTDAHTHQVIALAQHALTVRGAYYQHLDQHILASPRPDDWATSPATLAESAAALVNDQLIMMNWGCPLDETFGWLAVLTALPATNQDPWYDCLFPFLSGHGENYLGYADTHEGVTPPYPRHWVGVLPDGWAPLAFTAGLTPDEATARYQTRDLDPTALRALAALRGYTLPAFTLPGAGTRPEPVNCATKVSDG